MRHLLWALAALTLISCGPEDELLAAQDEASARAAVEAAAEMMPVEETPAPELQKLLDAIAAQLTNELDAQARPPEERVFYTVDVSTTPPPLPAPPCPRCR